ncbi:MAG: zinc ribbon domain-containing protein [Aeriscardovia sp.]|nr:zinc ribbon domain-containing protein [Aeriscardovia sp.]
MPVYRYKCSDCGYEFTQRQNFDDKPLTVCPKCGGKVRKVYAPASIQFKGSGFYRTDKGGAEKKPSKKGD